MKKETTTKSKLWLWIVIAAVLLLAIGGGILAFIMFGQNNAPAAEPEAGPRADLYWNLDREFYTANSQTGLSTREADANGQFKMRFAYNGEIVELVIIDKKLVNIIDTQDVLGLTFDENGVVIGQINVRELATEVGKKIYVKKSTPEMVYANSSMAMNGMELSLKLGEYAEIYDLRANSETYGKKIEYSDLSVMDCVTVYANPAGDITHIYLLSSGQRSKVYWRAEQWYDSSAKATARQPDADGFYSIDFYCEGEHVTFKTKDTESLRKIDSLGKHNAFTGLIFDDNGYIVGTLDCGVGLGGQQTVYAMDIVEQNGTFVKLKNNWSTSGAMNWEGEIPEGTPIYNVSTWAYSEGKMGQQISVSDLKLGDRLTIWSDMDGKPVQVLVTMRRVNMQPMFNNSAKYDKTTHTSTREKDQDGYYTFTFISEKGISKYKTKDDKLANFIDSYPERVFGIVTKGDKLLKAYEYECLYGYTRFSTALWVDAINGTIISCADQKKANAYTAVLSEDYKVLDISGDSKEYGTKIKLQVGDCMISFRNTDKEVCMIYVTKRAMGGKLYVNTTPNTDREPITKDANGNELKSPYWQFDMTDMNGKKVTLKLATGKKKDGVYANKYLQSRIDNATRGIIALEVSGKTIKDVHSVANMESGNGVATTIITNTKADGSYDFQYKTVAKSEDETSVYPGWFSKDGVKKINLSCDVKSHHGEKLTGSMKEGDVYYMVRNRANDTVALFLWSRGLHKDLYFVKDSKSASSSLTFREPDADGWYVFDVMYKGKQKTVKTKDAKLAAALDNKRTGAALKLSGNVIKAVGDYTQTIDAFASLVSNWDVTAVSGKNITLKLNIPSTSETEPKKLNIGSAKVYDISPTAGANYGKTTKLKKNDRVRIYTDKDGNITYVLVTVRNGVKTAKCEHCNKKVTWNPLTSTSGIGTGDGHYYVYEDWTVYSQLAVANTSLDEYEAVVDLNGKTVTQAGNNTRIFTVAYEGKTLTLLDSVGTGVLQGYGNSPKGEAGNANLIQVSYGATLNILSGTYKMLTAEDKVAPKQGGLIFSWSDDKYERNTIRIKGGTFIGGPVEHPARKTTDPLMQESFATAGAIYLAKTDMTMSGGTITGGIADRGGNLYLAYNSTFNMTGGVLADGIARNRGGNIYAGTGSTVTINGGTVTGGKIQGLEIEYVDEETGETKVKKTGQQGGNIFGHVVYLKKGEISNGTAVTTAGNIFLLGNDNLLDVSGGKIYGGVAPSGGTNVYVYGGEGLVNVTGGEILSTGGNHIGIAKDEKVGSAMSVTGGYVSGGVRIAADCGIIVGGDAQIGDESTGLTLAAGSLPLGITKLSEKAKIYVNAEGQFAKAAESAKGLDISAYAGKQIAHDNKQLGSVTCETIDDVQWLVANVSDDVQAAYSKIAADAIKMTEEGVFDVAEGTEAQVVEAECPNCKKTVQWAPLTTDMQHLNNTGYTHFYMAGDVNFENTGRYYAETGEYCVHLNGKTLNQGGDAKSEAAFKVSSDAILNLMGNGLVTGYGTYVDSVSSWTGGAIDARGTVNIIGGSYKSIAADRPAVGTWNGTGIVNMYAGTILGSDVADGTQTGSSSVRVRLGTFNLYGGTISGGKAKYGGNVAISGGTFNVKGGTITGGEASRGGNVYAYGGTFNLESGVVSDGKATNNLGGNFYIYNAKDKAVPTVNIKGGEVTNGTSANSGGSFGMYSEDNKAKLNISGGVISGGSTVSTGGLIYVFQGNLYITGGELKDASGKNGGLIGIDGSSAGEFIISGGTFSGGQATGSGGLIQLNNNATITGGTFTNGTAATGDGINLGNKRTLTLEAFAGTLDVRMNTESVLNVSNGVQANVEFINNTSKVVLADNLEVGTVITLSYAASDEAPLTEANANAAAYVENGYVVSSNPARPVKVNADNQIYVASLQTVADDLDVLLDTEIPEGQDYHQAYCPACGAYAQWLPLTDELLILDEAEGTHFYLAGDLTRTGKQYTTNSNTGTVFCVHLNGKTYNTGHGTANANAAFRVNSGSTMNIMDGSANAGTVIGAGYAHNAGSTASPNWYYGGGAIDARGTVNIYGGTYMTSHTDRPAVACFGGAGKPVINMYGGVITRNTAVVTTTDSSLSSLVRIHLDVQTFNMYGGTITGGMAKQGGNVYVSKGVFNLVDGTITGGQGYNPGNGNYHGGNVYMDLGTFNMSGGAITNGSSRCAGNIRVKGTFNMSGGVISGGTSGNMGGNIRIDGGTTTISGTAQILDGRTTSSGGAIGLVDGKLNVTGGLISGGDGSETQASNANSGGLLYIYAGTFNMTGGVMQNGVGGGGNIMINGGTDHSITGGTITGGKAAGVAREITVSTGKTLTLGAVTLGGDIRVGGTVTIQDGAKASLNMTTAATLVLPDNLTSATELTVVADANRTIVTHAKAAEYLALFKSGLDGATITNPEGTNDIVFTLPVVEPQAAPAANEPANVVAPETTPETTEATTEATEAAAEA